MVKSFIKLFILTILFSCSQQEGQLNNNTTTDPLPSWNDGSAKSAIISFVNASTSEGTFFIPVKDRIIVFDNDGTLWSEQPIYFQFAFAMDRIKELAPSHPEWKNEMPFKALLEGDINKALVGGKESILEIVMASHSGMTTHEFEKIVTDWIKTAKHPKTGKRYTEMVYQPMLELLDYLRENGFKTFIVSGGGIDFMRPWVESVYGIPPDQVIGSSGKVLYELINGQPVLVKLPEIDFIDDKEGKPVGIYKFIGKRPVAAFGNSDGDLAMLQWTAASDFKGLMVFIHHTDAEREWAYDRNSHIGKLDKGLDEALEKGWTIVDMKKDWNKIYPFE